QRNDLGRVVVDTTHADRRLAVQLGVGAADLGDGLDTGCAPHGLGRLVRERVVAGGDGVVGDEELVDRAGERGAVALADHGEVGDQGEPDHHRRRGGGGAGGGGGGGLSRERSRRAARP